MFTLPPNRLYHYCKLNTALKLILPKRRLLLGSLRKTNDPRENKSFLFGAIYKDDIGDLEARNREVTEILQSDCKVICFSTQNSNHWGYGFSRMWSLYGDNHKGLCIELDKEKFLEENSASIDRTLMRNIKYTEEGNTNPRYINHVEIEKIGKETYLREVFRKQHLDFLYFTKNREWDSENEIRLLHFSDKPGKEYCYIKSSLVNIYLGIDFKKVYLQSLINICKDVDISELHYADGRLLPKLIHQAIKQ